MLSVSTTSSLSSSFPFWHFLVKYIPKSYHQWPKQNLFLPTDASHWAVSTFETIPFSSYFHLSPQKKKKRFSYQMYFLKISWYKVVIMKWENALSKIILFPLPSEKNTSTEVLHKYILLYAFTFCCMPSESKKSIY